MTTQHGQYLHIYSYTYIHINKMDSSHSMLSHSILVHFLVQLHINITWPYNCIAWVHMCSKFTHTSVQVISEMHNCCLLGKNNHVHSITCLHALSVDQSYMNNEKHIWINSEMHITVHTWTIMLQLQFQRDV